MLSRAQPIDGERERARTRPTHTHAHKRGLAEVAMRRRGALIREICAICEHAVLHTHAQIHTRFNASTCMCVAHTCCVRASVRNLLFCLCLAVADIIFLRAKSFGAIFVNIYWRFFAWEKGFLLYSLCLRLNFMLAISSVFFCDEAQTT